MAGEKTTAAKKKEAAKQEEVVNNELATVDANYDLSELGIDADDLLSMTGLESVNADDIRIPFGKLYAKDANGRKKGDIELPDGTVIDGANGGALEGLSILKAQPVRVYFPQPFKPTNSFICRSFDNKVGAPDGEYAGQSCSECEFSKYPEEGGASPCREQWLLVCTLADGTLFNLQVSGIGVSEFKKSFLSTELRKGLKIVEKKLKAPILMALNLTMSVEMEKTDFGDFPKPVFRVNRDQPLVAKERLDSNVGDFKYYQKFEREIVESSTTFAQSEQGEHETSEETGQNSAMF